MVNLNKIYHFQGFRVVQHFPGGGGGGPTFSRGGGVPIETHILVIFQGGSRPPVPPPPSGSALGGVGPTKFVQIMVKGWPWNRHVHFKEISKIIKTGGSLLYQVPEQTEKACANKIVPDQTAPRGAVWSETICLLHLRNYNGLVQFSHYL